MGATPGMQWAQLLTQMGGQQNQAIASGAAAGAASKTADVKQQQQDMLAQQNQDQEVQHALQSGARYVGPGGMLQDQMTAPDGSSIVTHRPVNDDEYVATYPGAKGQPPVKMAWPPM